jgi:metal-responsive CopG/Arc/MetJ family transcriptional regulator
MKTIAISIDENMLRRVDRFTSKTGDQRQNRSQLIRQAVQKYVESLERQAEEEREREIFRRQRQRLERQAIALVKEQAKI